MRGSLELRPFTPEDFTEMTTWFSNATELAWWAGPLFRYPLDESQLEEYLSRATEEPPARRIFKAVDAESGAMIGHGELSQIWPHLSARLSRVAVGPAWRGQGRGRELIRLLTAEAFNRYDVNRVDLGVVRRNRAALACYRKAGYVPVGVWPGAVEDQQNKQDVVWLTRFAQGGP